jgi:hypothetical protein
LALIFLRIVGTIEPQTVLELGKEGFHMVKSLAAFMAVCLMIGLSACAPKGGQSGSQPSGQQQSKSQTQSAGQQSNLLDEELKKHGDMYKELLKYNREQAEKKREADRKLLENMRESGGEGK